jgi:hypothetical protein
VVVEAVYSHTPPPRKEVSPCTEDLPAESFMMTRELCASTQPQITFSNLAFGWLGHAAGPTLLGHAAGPTPQRVASYGCSRLP